MPNLCGNGIVDAAQGEVCDDGVNDALAGGCLPGCTAIDNSDAFFKKTVLQIAVDMPKDEWDAMRLQYKSVHSIYGSETCRTQPIPNPYSYYTGAVTIDGIRYAKVGLRKKGHIGSQSTLKPSIKIDLDRFVKDQTHEGVERFAINNSAADPSYQRTCLAYAAFTAAGLPAPRCTYARVSVNGVDLGLYVVVEEIKKPFIRRHFVGDEGNLYEGTASDFRPEFMGGFEQETNEKIDAKRADLNAVFNVVQNAKDELLTEQLEKLLNLEKFYRFWATEVLIWHRDGYAGNANNYFLYAAPQDNGRFHFLPWGPDTAFKPETRTNVPHSILADGALTYRFYTAKNGSQKFYTALDDVIADIWKPDQWVANVDKTSAILRAHLQSDETQRFDADVAALKTWIRDRQSDIAAVRAAGDPAWTKGMRASPCRIPLVPLSATFTTTWGTYTSPVFTAGSGTLSVTLDGKPLTLSRVGSRIGPTDTAPPRLQLVADTTDKRRFAFTVSFPELRYFEPFLVVGTHTLRTPPVRIGVVESDISQTPARTLREFEVSEGTWTFDQIGQQNGDAVSGSFQGTLYLNDPD